MTSLASVNENIHVEAVSGYSYRDFFTARPGLSLSSEFIDRVLTKISTGKEHTGFSLISSDLPILATDQNIIESIPIKNFLTEDELCVCVQQMITSQTDSESGFLLNNGNGNFFYLKNSVVGVYWVADEQLWYINAFALHEGPWGPGVRIFSKN